MSTFWSKYTSVKTDAEKWWLDAQTEYPKITLSELAEGIYVSKINLERWFTEGEKPRTSDMEKVNEFLKFHKIDAGAWWEKVKDENPEIRLTDFAKGTDFSYSKICKWVSGDEKMSISDMGKITRFLETGITYKGYKRMSNNDFSELLYELLVEFSDEITQQELADKIGVTQKTINEYQNSKTTPSVAVEMQYKILCVFYGMCFTDNGECLATHRKTMLQLAKQGLNGIIFDEDENDMDLFSSCIHTSEIKETEIFMQYSYPVQCILLAHFKAFFYDYDNVADKIACINQFRRLSAEQQNVFIVRLKESISNETYQRCNDLAIGECEGELWRDFFFDMITEYRDMIKMLRDNPNIMTQAKKQRKSEKQIARNRTQFQRKFSVVIEETERFTCGNYDSNITFQAVNFKLTLSYIEWYVWMLINLSEQNEKDIFDMLLELTK